MLKFKYFNTFSYFNTNEDRVFDHTSAQDLREQEEHPEIQGLRDCLVEYTKEELVSVHPESGDLTDVPIT